MPLSISLIPSVVTYDGATFAYVQVRVGDQLGETTKIPWGTFFGQEHVVPLEPLASNVVRLSTKLIKGRSTKQERRRIEAIGGRRHSGSGALIGNKSDGSTDRWRMENKFTTAASYSVKLHELMKLRSECRNAQVPVFNVDFQDKHTGATKDSWVLVPSKEWEKLVNGAPDNQ